MVIGLIQATKKKKKKRYLRNKLAIGKQLEE